MKAMKHLSLAEICFLPKACKQTRKSVFLAEMVTVVPWSRLEALIEPFYPKKGNGRPPMPLATMLRIHFMQQWFGYSAPASTKPGRFRLLEFGLVRYEGAGHRGVRTKNRTQ